MTPWPPRSRSAVAAVNKHDQLTLPEQPMLLFEFHGSPASVREQAETVQAIAAEHGGGHFEWADKPEDRSRLWKARHNAYFALLQMKPGCRAVTTDTCVPISRLAECFRETVADCERLKAEHGIPYGIVGHVGDGNFHVLMLCDPDKPEERDWVEAVNDHLVQRALDLDGTCTGEHGVGLHKIDFLVKEHGDATLDVMRAIKRALDPQNLMNPGKILRL